MLRSGLEQLGGTRLVVEGNVEFQTGPRGETVPFLRHKNRIGLQGVEREAGGLPDVPEFADISVQHRFTAEPDLDSRTLRDSADLHARDVSPREVGQHCFDVCRVYLHHESELLGEQSPDGIGGSDWEIHLDSAVSGERHLQQRRHETTIAPVAGLVAQGLEKGLPGNLSILLSGRLTWPAVAMLLDSGQPGFDALVAPGHVATVMGPEEWSFVAERHGIPAAVAGFTPESLLAALYSVLRQLIEQRPFLDNCYPQLVRPGGNPTARQTLARVMDVVDANWRGIGVIPASGFALNADCADLDARRRFGIEPEEDRKRAGEMPPGCDCARVVLGQIYPNECVLYGKACTPRQPIGPCMVSDEGACRIWWASGVRD